MGFRDRSKAGRSTLVPYLPGEPDTDRHARRLTANLNAEQAAHEAARARGLILTTLNDGHHWQFKGNCFLAEWWPSSAKLIFNKQWKRGIHCHDWQQVIREIDSKRKETK